MDSHNLAVEFPEYKDTIHILKTENAHFKVLFDKFQEVDKAIVRSDQRIDLISEVAAETLRKERLSLKEQLYTLLKNHHG
jgi:uncharacterized protein YdcH (DUF465 family)